MRKLIGFLSFSAVMLGGSAAFAQTQPFGTSGTMAFSGERLFAFYSHKETLEPPQGPDRTLDQTGFGFGWAAGAYPFNLPRLGFDYFVIDSLSIGGALGYADINQEDEDGDENGVTAFILAPRVGYFIGISDVFGFWPRGGFTYHSLDPDGGNNDQWGLALTLEAMFTISPVDHFAFLAGPTFDFDFMGEEECGNQGNREDCDHRYRSLGIQVGVMGYF